MAKYKFKSDLSQKGIANLISKLQEYKNVTLEQKRQQLVRNLLDSGAEKANAQIQASDLGKYYMSVSVKMQNKHSETRGYLIATGETFVSDEYPDFHVVLAVEFGAGIHYNKKENPKAHELGFGVGTFPGQTHAEEDGWYFWDEEKQSWIYSHGVKATMPMYEADKLMISKFVKIAKESFRG